jgi:type II secretory pathway pseudopilin PulG
MKIGRRPWPHRLRGLMARESGMTLIELAVSVGILVIVLGGIMIVLPSIQNSLNRQTNRTQSNDQARLAAEELDREIRSGNLLYDPQYESDPYMSLRIYTQANADTREGGNRCVQWRITEQKLQRRAWSVNWQAENGVVEAWRVVATGIANKSVNPTVKAFKLDPDPAKGNRTLIVTILSRTSTSAGSNTPVQISLSVTGRNTEYGYPTNVCSTIPP